MIVRGNLSNHGIANKSMSRIQLKIGFFVLLLGVLALPPCSGCIGCGYQVGAKSLFGQDVKTVYVPVFRVDDDGCRDLAERLTEAVCKRIEARTSYKVIGRSTADSVLEGRIVSRSRGTTLRNNFDDPRQKMLTMEVEIAWKDRRSRNLKEFDSIAWNTGIGKVDSNSYLYAELGQSELTQEQDQVEKIADQIVGMMEVPW